jgi:putative resolvase
VKEAPHLLTISEAARRLGVHPTTLRSWADKGLVKMVKLPSGYRRFSPAEIDRVRREMGIENAEDEEHPVH